MRQSAVIIAQNFLGPDREHRIGGIETYIQELASVLSGEYSVLIAQTSLEEFEVEYTDYLVVGLRCKGVRELVRRVLAERLSAGDLLVFSTEQYACSVNWSRAIVIQHGIHWDLPASLYCRYKLNEPLSIAYKCFDNIRNYARIARFRHIVCVDYAYLTWMRCLLPRTYAAHHVIPNFADKSWFDCPRGDLLSEAPIGVVFPRRLLTIRGTRLFAEVARGLLNEFKDVFFTICGSGPDEGEMKRILPPSERVSYICLKHRDMPSLMLRHHVVVVHSLGSEGTSLSAIEGMAAGRCVVASNVGGLPNVIANGFNGLLCEPTTNGLDRALREVLGSAELRARLGKNAEATARGAFHVERWRAAWMRVVDSVMQTEATRETAVNEQRARNWQRSPGDKR